MQFGRAPRRSALVKISRFTTLEVNGDYTHLSFFQINYPKMTLTLFILSELDFLAGCNGKGVVLVFFEFNFLAGCNGKGVSDRPHF